MKNSSGGRGVVAFSEEAFTARFKALWLACVNPATGSPYTPRAAAAQLRSCAVLATRYRHQRFKLCSVAVVQTHGCRLSWHVVPCSMSRWSALWCGQR